MSKNPDTRYDDFFPQGGFLNTRYATQFTGILKELMHAWLNRHEEFINQLKTAISAGEAIKIPKELENSVSVELDAKRNSATLKLETSSKGFNRKKSLFSLSVNPAIALSGLVNTKEDWLKIFRKSKIQLLYVLKLCGDKTEGNEVKPIHLSGTLFDETTKSRLISHRIAGKTALAWYLDKSFKEHPFLQEDTTKKREKAAYLKMLRAGFEVGGSRVYLENAKNTDQTLGVIFSSVLGIYAHMINEIQKEPYSEEFAKEFAEPCLNWIIEFYKEFFKSEKSTFYLKFKEIFQKMKTIIIKIENTEVLEYLNQQFSQGFEYLSAKQKLLESEGNDSPCIFKYLQLMEENFRELSHLIESAIDTQPNLPL